MGRTALELPITFHATQRDRTIRRGSMSDASECLVSSTNIREKHPTGQQAFLPNAVTAAKSKFCTVGTIRYDLGGIRRQSSRKRQECSEAQQPLEAPLPRRRADELLRRHGSTREGGIETGPEHFLGRFTTQVEHNHLLLLGAAAAYTLPSTAS
jgi:hypothetical protein